MPLNHIRLLALADREFRELTNQPRTVEPKRKFKPVKLNVARFDNTWECKRGAAVRLTAVLLREDDTTLERRVWENEVSAKTYASLRFRLRRPSCIHISVSKYTSSFGRFLALRRLSVLKPLCLGLISLAWQTKPRGYGGIAE